jgi:3-oxoacyl-[acyl-carrier-protein] synthase-3
VRPARIAALRYQAASDAVQDEALDRLLGVEKGTAASFAKGRQRYFAPDGIGPTDLAYDAATRALSAARLAVSDVDLILFATNTPDLVFPGSSCFLQRRLDCATVPCLDVRAQCLGFLVALDLATRFVATETYARILVACGEVPSHQNRFDGTDPALTCLTADGAAVAIVDAGEGPGRVLAVRVRGDGRAHRDFWCEFPSSRHRERTGVARGERLTRWMLDEGKIFPVIDVSRTRATALREVPPLFDEVLAAAGTDSVDATIVAHVDPETEAELALRLGERAGRVHRSDVLYTYSASLPIALARAVDSGRIRSGERVAMVASGSGASWGVAIVSV